MIYLIAVALNFVLEYAIKNILGNQDGLEFNMIHKLLIYADDVNLFEKI
jgi:hypothetical protein